MSQEADPEIESSPLCGPVTRDGITVRLEIYRLASSNDGWSLEVVDQDGTSTVWDDLFPTDEEAYTEFCRALEADGVGSFLERDPKESLH